VVRYFASPTVGMPPALHYNPADWMLERTADEADRQRLLEAFSALPESQRLCGVSLPAEEEDEGEGKGDAAATMEEPKPEVAPAAANDDNDAANDGTDAAAVAVTVSAAPLTLGYGSETTLGGDTDGGEDGDSADGAMGCTRALRCRDCSSRDSRWPTSFWQQ